MDYKLLFKEPKLLLTLAFAIFLLISAGKMFIQDFQNKEYIDSNFIRYSGIITNIEIAEPNEFILSINKDSVYDRKVVIELDSNKLFQSNLYFAMRKSDYGKINGLSKILIPGKSITVLYPKKFNKTDKIVTFYELTINSNSQKLLTINNSIPGKGQMGRFRNGLLFFSFMLLLLVYLGLRFPHIMEFKIYRS